MQGLFSSSESLLSTNNALTIGPINFFELDLASVQGPGGRATSMGAPLASVLPIPPHILIQILSCTLLDGGGPGRDPLVALCPHYSLI